MHYSLYIIHNPLSHRVFESLENQELAQTGPNNLVDGIFLQDRGFSSFPRTINLNFPHYTLQLPHRKITKGYKLFFVSVPVFCFTDPTKKIIFLILRKLKDRLADILHQLIYRPPPRGQMVELLSDWWQGQVT